MTPDEREPRNDRPNDRYRSRDGNGRGSGRGYRPRDDRRQDRGHEYRRRDGDRPRQPREGGEGEERRSYRPREDRRPRDGDDREGGRRPYRPRQEGGRGRPRDDRGRDRGFRGRDDRRPSRPREEERPRVSIPETVTEILHKGIDCEENGRTDLAQVLYLHGAAMLNGGCEKNLVRMLKKAGPEQFSTVRGRIKADCPNQIMPVFDYLCSTIDPEYDTEYIRISADRGNIIAIHCLIRMGALEKDDPLVDTYADSLYEQTDMILVGLDLLARKKGSEKAAKYLEDYQAFGKLKQSIRPVFVRANKGEASARKELNRLAGRFPEAKFLEGYIQAVSEDNAEQYIRREMREYKTVILSYLQELDLPNSPYSKYLRALKVQSKGGDWISPMVEAVHAGSDEALDALEDVQNTWQVRRLLSTYYLAKGDIENLVLCFDGRDTGCLDKYCNKDPEKIIEVAGLIGGYKEIDWLSKNYRNGVVECRMALINIATDPERYCKSLLYALHDSGADIEAARVYFDMMDDPAVPSVKWLAKVCRNEEAKEYVRSRFGEMDDLETFESIFEDDGYIPRYQLKREERAAKKRRY